MNPSETSVKGVRLAILQKADFEMAGYKRPVNLGDGSIARFLRQLEESGKMKRLSETLAAPQQVWVCLSDCQSCGRGCTGYHVCCRVCVEKTERHDFSAFAEDEISVFSLPASEWALYEAKSQPAFEALHRAGIYEVVKERGYQWNKEIPLHFDNEHECYIDGRWTPGKIYRLLLPVVPLA